MINRINLTIFLMMLTLGISAQVVLLEEEVKLDDKKPRFGQNLAYYNHFFLDLSFPVFENQPGSEIKYGSSLNYTLGFRNKFKLCKYDDIGFEVFFNKSRFSMDESVYGMDDIYPTEKLLYKFGAFGVSAFNRINFGKRGNMIKGFIDLGGYADLHSRKRRVLQYKNPQEEKVQIITSRLKQINDFQYGVFARIGWKSLALKASYRLSNYFKDEPVMAEFPRLSIGAEIGLLRK